MPAITPNLAAFSRSHFKPLCTTGGWQPYGTLQQHAQRESASWFDTAFIDAPSFTPAGSSIQYNSDQDDRIIVLESIATIEGRL